MRRKALVTGGNGQLGTAFRELLPSLDVDCYAPARNVLDVTDESVLKKTLEEYRPDVLINCSAFNDVDGAESRSDAAFAVNSEAPQRMASLCGEMNVFLIHFSTDYVFDGKKQIPYLEADEPNPLNVYGKSKLAGEWAVLESSFPCLVIRTSWVFGNGGGPGSNFLKKVYRWSVSKDTIAVVDDQVSSPAYAPDLARGAWSLYDLEAQGLFHLSNEGFCSRYEWAKLFLKATGWKGLVKVAESGDFPAAAERPKFSALDTGKATKIGVLTPAWQDATLRYVTEKLVSW